MHASQYKVLGYCKYQKLLEKNLTNLKIMTLRVIKRSEKKLELNYFKKIEKPVLC